MAISSSARLHLPPSCRRSPAVLSSIDSLHAARTCRWWWGLLPVAPAPLRLRLRAVRATDDAAAARPLFDHGPRRAVDEERRKLKIAVVGFGNYGHFLARTLVEQGHTVVAHSRSDYSAAAAALGATFYGDPHDLCECQPDVVLLVTSILSAEAVLRSLPVHRFRRNTLFADVLSVKEFPKNLLLASLPEDFDIICTHPMFGPESARDGWEGLPFVFDEVRVGDCPARRARADAFLDICAREGCRMVEMPCAEHDAHAAETQFLTHTVGRMLAMLELRRTPVDTKGYETLLRLVNNTCSGGNIKCTCTLHVHRICPPCSDSFDLYNGLFMYNNNSTELLHRLEGAMDSVKRKLLDGLHDVHRRQLLEGSPPLNTHGSDSSTTTQSPS